MKTFQCRRCYALIKYKRESGSGRTPWYCRPCVQAKEVERIQLRNAQDRIKRLAKRDPLCGDCRQALEFDDSRSRRGMRIYCDACLTRRKRLQDSRRSGAGLMNGRKRGAATAPATPAV
jgi:hypothetical protein